MLIHKLKSKIHKATITQCHINYDGSLGLDESFMTLAGMQAYEKVLVANLSNGSRFETYLIKAKKGSGIVSLNGAAARLGAVGDRVIILAFALVDEKEAGSLKPRILIMDDDNHPRMK
ncbi:MAG: aspartate 1-decarboxylase [Candidatus Aureabacteria bacterium]|nr:aspartate 1-decarboxylase [Candidatus Auribacterota bacterium]